MSQLDKVKEFIGGLSKDSKIHMSSKPIDKLTHFSQEPGPKPHGLWYDCEGEWIDWVSSEMPDWVQSYVYEVHLNKAVMLELKSEGDLLDFTEEYGTAPEGYPPGSAKAYYIDWGRVASKYAGVEICPYQWGLRMDQRTYWYYGWDIASGCVWNPIGVDVRFIGLWDEEKGEVISKDELIKGDVTAKGLDWYKISSL
jgi:hypothetical protein